MQELSVLKLFCDKRAVFDSHYPYLTRLENLEREIKTILTCIHQYYDRYKDHEYIGKKELKAFYDFQYPNSKDREIIHEMISALFEADVSNSVARDLLEQVIERSYAAIIVDKLVPVIEGNRFGVVPNINNDVERFVSLMKNPPKESRLLEACDLTVEELVRQEIDDEGIPWHLENLTQIIGGVRRQTLGLIYAFVDSGKTSFGLSACASFAHFLKDTPDIVVYAGNEESAPRLSLRLTQAMLNVTRHDIQRSPADIEQQRRERGFTRVRILDNITHISEVHRLLEEWRPRIVMIDQGTKVSLDVRNVKEIKEVQLLFNYYREAAKEFDTSIICLAQGVGEAENRKWLKLSDIYGSRVAIQGELDYAIGIGRVQDDQSRENYRYINIPKNKLLDGETGKFITLFQKESCLWRPI